MRTRFALASLAAVAAVSAEFSSAGGPRFRVRANPSDPEHSGWKPDFTGVWQAMNTANWDIQAHEARRGPVIALGAAFSVPAGIGIVEGNEIPYLPAALAKKKENAENWLSRDPEIKCYLPGVPRVMYMPYPINIVQGRDTILMASEFASASRTIRMNSKEKSPAEPGWVGRSDGGKAIRSSSRSPTRRTRPGSDRAAATTTASTESHRALYLCAIGTPSTTKRRWTTRRPFHGPGRSACRCIATSKERAVDGIQVRGVRRGADVRPPAQAVDQLIHETNGRNGDDMKTRLGIAVGAIAWVALVGIAGAQNGHSEGHANPTPGKVTHRQREHHRDRLCQPGNRRGREPAFIVTDSRPKPPAQYRLDGDADILRLHVGHTVEIGGPLAPASGGAAVVMPTLKVQSLTYISTTCSSPQK